MTDPAPLYFVSPGERAIEQQFRAAGETPYVATVLAMLGTQFEATSRLEAQERTLDGTWRARATTLTEAERLWLAIRENEAMTPLRTASGLYKLRLASIRGKVAL